jgi:hypothetical protein
MCHLVCSHLSPLIDRQAMGTMDGVMGLAECVRAADNGSPSSSLACSTIFDEFPFHEIHDLSHTTTTAMVPADGNTLGADIGRQR